MYHQLRRVAIALLLFTVAFSGNAVLKEGSLGQTIDVLEAELENTYREQQKFIEMYKQRAAVQHDNLVKTMKRIDQISLMLYSQRQDFTFDMAYACQEATNLYRDSQLENVPYARILEYLNTEITRADSLIVALKNISPRLNDDNSLVNDTAEVDSLRMLENATRNENNQEELFKLSQERQQRRLRCLTYARAIRANLVTMAESISEDKRYYELVNERLKNINDYAMKCYDELREGIFENGGQNYFRVLMSLPMQLRMSQMDITDKYSTLQGQSEPVKSQWRGPVLLGISIFIIFYIAIATVLSTVLMRWLLPKRLQNNDWFKSKKGIIGLASGVLLFTISISIANSFVYHNFIAMAIKLVINFAWLLLAILVSMLIRLRDEQLKSGLKAYLPFIVMAFIVIVFRIIFIPNTAVNLIYPLLLLLFTIWQWRTLRKHRDVLAESDKVLSVCALVFLVVCTVLAWIGYTLLAVQIMMWWVIQLAFILTIVCFYHIAMLYERRFILDKLEAAALKNKPAGRQLTDEEITAINTAMKKGDHITRTWFFDLITKAALPIFAVISVLMSVEMAAKMFDMNEIFRNMFFFIFIDEPGLLQLSLYKLVLALVMFFVFRYINYLAHSLYRFIKYKKHKNDVNYRVNLTLANNIITILVWGIYFIGGLVLFQVPKSGISLITAGLATGLGFAMKDILENFIYGLSLMSGRVRVGDYIECDGILGKVESISYQSTQITTLDGSIIAFLNTSLFNKNFKNLTRNHSYEYVKVPVGVAYGVKVDHAREVIVEALQKLPVLKGGRSIIRRKQGYKVVVNDFGDNSVDLLVTFWVLVEEKIPFVCAVKEAIYNALQEAGIEIPFPQRDVYIRQLPEKPAEEQPVRADFPDGEE